MCRNCWNFQQSVSWARSVGTSNTSIPIVESVGTSNNLSQYAATVGTSNSLSHGLEALELPTHPSLLLKVLELPTTCLNMPQLLELPTSLCLRQFPGFSGGVDGKSLLLQGSQPRRMRLLAICLTQQPWRRCVGLAFSDAIGTQR